jgi:DNA-binding MarR family transcriptional regulator
MPQNDARQGLLGAVGHATQAYQRATDGFDDEVGRSLDLNPSDLRCLDWLTDGPLTAGELAAATGLSNAAMTNLIDRLERRGFVARVRDSVDRRRVLVELTTEGGAKLGRFYGPLADEGGALLGGFSDEDLARVHEFLVEATAVIGRHRDRIRNARTDDRPAS